MIDPQLSQNGPATASSKTLRQFAALCLVVFGGLAWAGYSHGKLTGPIIFSTLAVTLGPLGLIKPEAIRPVFAGCMKLAHPIGLVVSQLVLAVLFYGLFTPVALLFRLIGRDVLALRRRAGAASYWKPKPAAAAVRSYFRQS